MWYDVTDRADPGQVAQVVALARVAPARCGTTRVVSIDGRSGSGKTTLALAVAEALDAPVVHVDHFYPGWDGLAEGVRILVDDVLEPISRGERATYPTWDWELGEWGPRLTVPPTDLLVVEGCGSSSGAARRYAAVRVWVEAAVSLRQERGFARDGDAYVPNWQRWADQEDALFGPDRTAERADLVLDTGISDPDGR